MICNTFGWSVLPLAQGIMMKFVDNLAKTRCKYHFHLLSIRLELLENRFNTKKMIYIHQKYYYDPLKIISKAH